MSSGVLDPLRMTDQSPPTELLRFATAGSVDDGKSTLLGRLLYDSKSLFEDQIAAVEALSASRGHEWADLSLFTDGLRAEREQGITIDVAYRYFATPRRRFIIADTPGHLQYTRNMVTGASTADVALILVDARKRLVEQSRRHAFLCSLLRVPRLVLCVNKMDLVGWSGSVFHHIREEFSAFAAQLGVPEPAAIPISALHGDNIVSRSANMPWYDGPSLLDHLEGVHVASYRNLVDARFPVQYVIRPQSSGHPDYRGYAGQIASGTLRPGDEVVVLPSGLTSVISSIETADGPVPEAFPPMSVTIRLAGDLDVARGDMICVPHHPAAVTREVEAMVCWMDDTRPLTPGGRYTVKHTTRSVRAVVSELSYRLDVNSLGRDTAATSLSLNEIGLVRLRTMTPLLCDEYPRNRVTGSLIIIDETTNATVAAGMITRTR
ncbi:GTP-binding protein [Sphaerisporangium sp. TRM90804]|uniref:sulfate adenylyltransferase subunit 1 n=1 Tax=Sphaerisporangium sp. TRM90804 TaxID=3031113 RepID=UPI00244B2726|nr:GTP-binding protein [Sphaerisporangium sp. TRM90804]MDH2428342.1 GTP-binding protein [Sphaerisporangium sp. TRM90804]